MSVRCRCAGNGRASCRRRYRGSPRYGRRGSPLACNPWALVPAALRKGTCRPWRCRTLHQRSGACRRRPCPVSPSAYRNHKHGLPHRDHRRGVRCDCCSRRAAPMRACGHHVRSIAGGRNEAKISQALWDPKRHSRLFSGLQQASKSSGSAFAAAPRMRSNNSSHGPTCPLATSQFEPSAIML